MTSRSLVVCLYGLSNESETCDKIQEILLALHARIENLSIFLSGRKYDGTEGVDLKDVRKLFSRLYETGIVIEQELSWDEEVR